MSEHIVAAQCRRCGSNEYVDTTLERSPHNGQSVRRDCAHCRWTFGFPLWYGEPSRVEPFVEDFDGYSRCAGFQSGQ